MSSNTKVVGNFGFNGWATSPEERLKALLVNYRCSNTSQSILYKDVVSMGKAYQSANHDPDLLARKMRTDLEGMCNSNFERSSVTTTVVNNNDGTYNIEVAVAITENDQRYDLHSILKSEEKDIFADYDKTYFEFKF